MPNSFKILYNSRRSKMKVLVLIQDCITSVHVKWQNPDFLKNISFWTAKSDTNIFAHLNTFTSCSMGRIRKALSLYFLGQKNPVIALQNIRHDFGDIKAIEQKLMERI